MRTSIFWCWSPSARPVEWDRRTLVVGGLSPFGLITAGATAAVSAKGNRSRRDAALRECAPRWRYVTSSTGSLEYGRLVIREESGIKRSIDLRG